MNTYRGHGTRTTSQLEPIPGSAQVENSAGGYSFQLDDFDRLDRFLILGTEGGTYYAGQYKLTKDSAELIRRCLDANPVATIQKIIQISHGGRAPKNTPAIFALAVAAAHPKGSALALASLSEVCRTGTHLFQFAELVQEQRGWGRGLRRAVASWYQRDADDVAYQVVKYRQREGWTHRDLLRLAHPKALNSKQELLFEYITHREQVIRSEADPGVPRALPAFEVAQAAETPGAAVQAITTFGSLISREMLRPEVLTAPEVWEALLQNGLPYTALVRNLANMTRIGLLTDQSPATQSVVDRLTDGEKLRKARVHPLAILSALRTYASGESLRGSNTWTPITQITDALDAAFYASFRYVEPTGKRIMLALDVSGSMGWGEIAGMGLTPREGAAAMALVTAATEKQAFFRAFSHELIPISISPRQRLDDVVRQTSRIPFGGTDCSLPMQTALKEGLEVDAFVVYTDSETWAGRIHPVQALRQYREKTGIDAKLVVVGMVANEFTIADPADPGMLDVVGFDTATPAVISHHLTS